MKKVLIIAVTIVAVIALGNVLLASAQGGIRPNQPNATCPVSGYTCSFSGTTPYGRPGGMRGMMGGGIYTDTMPMYGYMMGANGVHQQVWTAVATKLGLTYEQLTQAVQNGQTIAQLAEAKGVSLNDLKEAARGAITTLLADLVKQGVMTQTQADWMADHLDDMPMFNFDRGFGPGMMQGQGMMGRGMMGGRVPGVPSGMMRNWQQPTGPQG